MTATSNKRHAVKVAFITHPSCAAAGAIADHPERPQRLLAIEETLMSQGLYDCLCLEEAPSADLPSLQRAHTREHIQSTLAEVPEGELRKIDEDTYMNSYTAEAALHAAGALVLATDLVADRVVDRAFCCVRPPGHHATRSESMGFCFFNNVAVGVLHALSDQQFRRVAVLDFDAHDCNGTVDILQDESRVLICSLFQHPLYPYGGTESRNARIVKTPLPAGAGSVEVQSAVLGSWFPAVETFEPELIFVSAGFDGHAADDISDLQLKSGDYRWLTEQIVALANRSAGGRVISALEGGYQPEALGRSAAAHVRALMGL